MKIFPDVMHWMHDGRHCFQSTVRVLDGSGKYRLYNLSTEVTLPSKEDNESSARAGLEFMKNCYYTQQLYEYKESTFIKQEVDEDQRTEKERLKTKE